MCALSLEETASYKQKSNLYNELNPPLLYTQYVYCRLLGQGQDIRASFTNFTRFPCSVITVLPVLAKPKPVLFTADVAFLIKDSVGLYPPSPEETKPSTIPLLLYSILIM
jgi:hypothetical protein